MGFDKLEFEVSRWEKGVQKFGFCIQIVIEIVVI